MVEWSTRRIEYRYFKNKMRLKRETFNVILEKLCPRIELTPTNIKPNPTSTHR